MEILNRFLGSLISTLQQCLYEGGFSLTVCNEDKIFFRRFIFIVIPLVIQELINAAVNMADTVMIGKLGIHEVTAVGLSNQIFFLFILVCFGISGGASIFMGQFTGKNDYHSIHKIMGIAFVCTTLAALFFSVCVTFFPENIIRIYTKDDLVIELSAKYLKPVAFSYFFTAISIVINASLRSIGQTKFPLVTTVIALFCSVTLNYIFIFIFHMGVFGAGLSTLIARGIELILQIILIWKLKLPVGASLKSYLSMNSKFIKMFLVIAAPVIFTEIGWSVGTSLYHVAFQYAGTEGQGAMQISMTVQNMFMVIGMSIGTSCGILTANLLGSGEFSKAIRYSRIFLWLATGFSFVMGIILIFLSPVIINFFDIPDSAKQNVQNILYVIAFGIAIRTFNYTSIVGILRSGGDTKFCLFITLASVWFVGVPMAFIGAIYFDLPIHLILVMAYSEEIIKAVLSGIRVFSNKWVNTIVD